MDTQVSNVILPIQRMFRLTYVMICEVIILNCLQMCFDEKSQKIFVFGGRILTSSSKSGALGDERPIPEFGGLYSYCVIRNEWKLLREDSGNAGPQDIRSRIGHSMLLDTVRSYLNTFAN